MVHGWVRLLAALCMLGLAAPVAADFGPLAAPATAPSHVIQHFPLMGQWWNLSCEYAATSAATAYFGKTISQGTFVNMIGFVNPNKGFRGDLSGPWGGTWQYGVYAPPILAALMQSGFAHSYIFHADPMLLRERSTTTARSSPGLPAPTAVCRAMKTKATASNSSSSRMSTR